MSIIEQIKAEIERRQKENVNYDENGNFASYCDFSVWYALDSILTFISGLEKSEKPMNLEEEIDAIWNPRFNLGWDENSLISMNHMGFEKLASHFAQWGVEHLKK